MSRLAIAVFIDACGWDVVQPRPWFLPECGHRQPVRSLFGFSSACVPAILTGRLPNENDHWSSFFYAPQTSPFRSLQSLSMLPASVVDRGRVRRWVSLGIARAHGFTGYFQVYNLPFEHLKYFDYAERNDIFRPGGINRGTSIFDDLAADRIPHHVSNWRRSEPQNIDALLHRVRAGDIRFAFLYTANLDALMHEHTKDSPRVDTKVAWYDGKLRRILREARQHHEEIRVAVFSDHGMATVRRVVDWMPRLQGLGLRFGVDFAAVYDSTMLRFWFLRDGVEARVRGVLSDGDAGAWVSDETAKAYGTWWPDGKFGHAVYALEPGVLLNPSDMGRVAPAGMHGYRPDHPDSDAALVSNFEPETSVARITDLYGVMREMARWSAG
jgi:hypothetical protein